MEALDEHVRQIENVTHREQNGTATFYSSYLVWESDNNSRTMRLVGNEIGNIKFTLDSRSLQQILVTRKDMSKVAFGLMNPAGEEQRAKDKKEMLAYLRAMQEFKEPAEVNLLMECKCKILDADESLRQLYKDLVDSKIITDATFWEDFVSESLMDVYKAELRPTVTGLLSNLKATDRDGTRTYDLTSEMITNVFELYPEVRKKYLDNVPHKISEQTFWTNYLRSNALLTDDSKAGSDDELCVLLPGDVNAESYFRREWDKLTDNEDDTKLKSLFSDTTPRKRTIADRKSSSNSLSQSINMHSMRILNSFLRDPKQPRLEPKRVQTPTPDPVVVVVLPSADSLQCRNQLQHFLPTQRREGQTASNPPLDTYIAQMQEEMFECDARLGCQTSPPFQPTQFEHARKYLSRPPKPVVRKVSVTSDEDLEQKEGLKGLLSSSRQLISHFWRCFPANTPELRKKALRLGEELIRFRKHVSVQITKIRNSVEHAQFTMDNLQEMFQKAIEQYRKFKALPIDQASTLF